MANQRKLIGKIPVYRGEWNSGNAPYHKLNDVTLFGCTFRSKIDNNSYAPATIGEDGNIVINENWSLIASGFEADRINKEIEFINSNENAYNVSRFHLHTGYWEAIEYDESQQAYLEAKQYSVGEKVNLVNYTEHTFVAKKQMTGSIPDYQNISNKYTLEEAVLFVPKEYQISGIEVGFISSDTNKPVFHRYNGGTFSIISNWTYDAFEKLTELEENLHDIEGNLHGNIYDIPAFVYGSEPNYKCYFKKDDLFSINIECNSSLKIFLKDKSGKNVPFYHDGTLKTIIESDGNGDYTVIPQSDVYYIRVTDNVDNCNLTIKSIRRTIAELEDYLGADIEAEKEKLSYKSYVTVDYNDKYITTGGNINIGDTVDTLSFTELTGCKCIIKNIEGNQKFYIKGQCGDAYRLYAFLDENNNLLERSKTNISGEFFIESPINSKKAIFCFIGDGYVYEQSSITYKNLQYSLYSKHPIKYTL